MHVRKKQSGATLITAMIMLIVLTLLVVSGIRASNTNLRIAGNMQMQAEAAAAAQQAIERVISTSVFDLSTQIVGDYTVTFNPLICHSFWPIAPTDPKLPAECKGMQGSCFWTTFEITASAIDARTGVTAEIHQGVLKPAGTDAFTNCAI